MRDNVFWRKEAAIIMMLAEELGISAERALDIFFRTDVCRKLSNPATGLRLMSNGYVVEEILNELRTEKSPETAR